jgi:hypothetical protein
VWGGLLYLRPGTREHFLDTLAREWPELVPDYERMYAGRAYLPGAVSTPVRDRVAALAREHGIADRRADPARPPRPPTQLTLGI